MEISAHERAPDRLCTTLPLDPAESAGDPCEAVVVQSVSAGGHFAAIAVRSWVSAMDGTGLEADTTDPVDILAGTDDGDLAGFHVRALSELQRRRRFDFEVADLFAGQIP